MNDKLARVIDTRPFFYPVHELPPFRNESKARGEELPLTRKLAAEGLNLPTYGALTEAEQSEIASVIRDFPR
jgi:perosamine synthetase